MPGYKFSGPNGTFDSYLLLEDGSVFLGKHFGADTSIDGEVGKLLNKPDTWFSIRQETETGTWMTVFRAFGVKVQVLSVFFRVSDDSLISRRCIASVMQVQ